VIHAAHKQPSACQRDHRQRDLNHYQRAAQGIAGERRGTSAASAALERFTQPAERGAQRGRHSEKQGGQQRYRAREREDAPVHANLQAVCLESDRPERPQQTRSHYAYC